jgi:hypothetical protein
MSSRLPLPAAFSIAMVIGLIAAPASGGAARPTIVQHTAARGAGVQSRVLDYWTPARMAAALPLKGPVTAPVKAAVTGPATGSAATNGARWAGRGEVTRAIGRVFLTIDGHDFVCSGSALGAVAGKAGRDLVVTAGHCAKDGTGSWARNWTFVPGYDSGLRPYGAFTARRMFVPRRWSGSGDDDFDVALVAVAPHGGRHLSDVVGGLGIRFNGPRGQTAYGFGFPTDPPYDGQHLMYCAGRVHDDPRRQTKDQGLHCALTAGSSGGPWLTGFDPASGRGTITSVSSFKYTDDQDTMYGPYFGGEVKDLYDTARKG